MSGLDVKNEYASGAKKRLVVVASPTGVAGSSGAIEHIVSGEVDGVGFEVVVEARDALWAMSMVSTMTEVEFNALRRVEAGVVS